MRTRADTARRFDNFNGSSQLTMVARAPEVPELLHPRMADVYREKVGKVCLGLENEESRTSAVDAIRALIEAILLEFELISCLQNGGFQGNDG